MGEEEGMADARRETAEGDRGEGRPGLMAEERRLAEEATEATEEAGEDGRGEAEGETRGDKDGRGVTRLLRIWIALSFLHPRLLLAAAEAAAAAAWAAASASASASASSSTVATAVPPWACRRCSVRCRALKLRMDGAPNLAKRLRTPATSDLSPPRGSPDLTC